jgi:hypothetical protein
MGRLVCRYVVVFNVLYLQRFILAMHYSTHKRLFKPGFFSDIVNKSIIVLVAPIFGIPSNTYWLHHIVMHHVDNNEWNKDLSATVGLDTTLTTLQSSQNTVQLMTPSKHGYI